jgi:hypothetical protein
MDRDREKDRDRDRVNMHNGHAIRSFAGRAFAKHLFRIIVIHLFISRNQGLKARQNPKSWKSTAQEREAAWFDLIFHRMVLAAIGLGPSHIHRFVSMVFKGMLWCLHIHNECNSHIEPTRPNLKMENN